MLFIFTNDKTVYLGEDSSDQATAESYWSPGHIQSAPEDEAYVQPEEYFPSTHGLVQTHPASFNGFGSMYLIWTFSKTIYNNTNIIVYCHIIQLVPIHYI